MWYVIQTKALKEREMVLKCQDILKDGEEVFTMETEKQKRIKGEWQTVREVTFQKYIFVETDDPDDLRIRLRDVKGMTKMLLRKRHSNPNLSRRRRVPSSSRRRGPRNR